MPWFGSRGEGEVQENTNNLPSAPLWEGSEVKNIHSHGGSERETRGALVPVANWDGKTGVSGVLRFSFAYGL